MEREVLSGEQVRRILRRLAHEIVERTKDIRALVLVGLRSRGSPMAERLAGHVERLQGVRPPVGALDVTLYRDDLDRVGDRPPLQRTHLPFPVGGKEVILVDDVLHTGRTTRAALAALADFGRSKRVRLAVLVDRGGRELPVRADYVGRNLSVRPGEDVQLLLRETDWRDAVVVHTVSPVAESSQPEISPREEKP